MTGKNDLRNQASTKFLQRCDIFGTHVFIFDALKHWKKFANIVFSVADIMNLENLRSHKERLHSASEFQALTS